MAGAPGATYHRTGQMALGGKGAWDYMALGSGSRRLFITRATHISVVNVDTGKVVGDIPNMPGVHGVAFAPDLNRGFASCGGEGTVVIFDFNTLKEIGRIRAGSNPDGICYDSFTKRVFAFNGGSKDATVLDAVTGKALGTIPMGGKPEFAVTDGQGQVFVNVENTSQVLALDAQSLNIKQRWSLAPGDGPAGLSIDLAHHRLFAVCGNGKMVVIDSRSGQVVASPAIGKGADATAFDPETGLVFSSNGDDGTLTILHEDTPTQFSIVSTLLTGSGGRTMALDTKTHSVYVGTATLEPVIGKLLSRIHRGYKRDSFTVLVFGPQ